MGSPDWLLHLHTNRHTARSCPGTYRPVRLRHPVEPVNHILQLRTKPQPMFPLNDPSPLRGDTRYGGIKESQQSIVI